MTIQELEALQKKLAEQVDFEEVIASICALQKAILDTKRMEWESYLYRPQGQSTGAATGASLARQHG